MLGSNCASRSIEIRDPDLRSILLGRNKCKPLPIRRPSWAVGILIRNDLSFTAGVPHVSLIMGNVGIVVLIATKRHQPYVWRLRVRLQINIDCGKKDPFTVGRGNRFLNAPERHHVFKGERMLDASNGGEPARNHKTREQKIRGGGGAQAVESQHSKGRLTARDRIGLLADPGTFFELGIYAASGMYEEWGGAPAAGVITGLARVQTRLVMIIANDATVKAGAFFPTTAKKVI